jgi:large subunit ribosomal protein L6e
MNSGLLLVTGPYAFNGVPIRRAHQKSVITTTTIIEIEFKIPDFITDSYFSIPKPTKNSNLQNVLKAENPDEVKCTDERKETQKLVDENIINHVKTIPYLKDYLSQKFSLSKGQLPHTMNF